MSAKPPWYWMRILRALISPPGLWRAQQPGRIQDVAEGPLGATLRDLRLGARRLRKEKGFALCVALTLSLGIGASTAVFGVISATTAGKIPFDEAARLVVGRTTYRDNPGSGFNGVSLPNFIDYRETNRSFEHLAAIWDGFNSITVTGGDAPWVARYSVATGNLFATLRVAPLLGRAFLPEEEGGATPEVAMISYGLWQTRFGGAPDVIGRRMRLGGSTYAIVGVLPQTFRLLHEVDIWLPTSLSDQRRDMNAFLVVGRLGRNVSLAQAQADVDAISRGLEAGYPDANRNASLRLTTLQRFLGTDVYGALPMPLAAAGCLLLIGCANVAGLLLARGRRRTAEVAVRGALGASRIDLVRQQLLESVMLSMPAGALGLGLAFVFQRVLLRLVPMEALGVTEPVVNGTVLLFAALVSVATGVVVGIVPALRVSALAPSAHLGGGRQQVEQRKSAGLQSGLVVLQIAVSAVLVVGSGLLTRSLDRLSNVDLGFSTDRVVAASIRVPEGEEGGTPGEVRFFAALLEEIRTLPSVRSAGAVSRLPIRHPGGTWRTRASHRPLIEGEYGGERTFLRRATPGYFATLGMPILKGRDFLDTDRPGAPEVAVVSASLGERLYPGLDPVGRRVLLLSGGQDTTEAAYEIVGVVRDARLSGPWESPEPAMYLAALQREPRALILAARVTGDPTSLSSLIRRISGRLNPDAVVTAVAPLKDLTNRPLAEFGMVVAYLGVSSGLALLLAAVGLYGALAFFVVQMEHELGVRMAVGAARSSVLGLVLNRGGRLVLLGLLLGGVAAYPGTALLKGRLFEIGPWDPVSILGALLTLGLVAAPACMIPALRATRVDPIAVLRGH